MDKLIGIAGLLFLTAPSDVCAQYLEQYFAQSPSVVLPLLDKTAKLDLLDLYNGRLPAKAENVLGGQSEMIRKSDTFLALRLTDVSTWEMKVLASGGDTLIICVHSVDAGGVASRLTAYHADWREAKCNLPHPDFEQFFVSDNSLSATRNQALRALLRTLPVEAAWSETADVLTFSVSIGGLSAEDRADAAQCLRPLSFEWVSGKFQPIARMKDGK